MLISFSVSNFRSISEKQTISLQRVGKIQGLPDNVIKCTGVELLRTIIVYGRNASGKSNLLLAMDTLKKLVSNPEYDLTYAYNPNKLNRQKQNQPVWFELVFIAHDGIKYKYELSYDSDKILNESLYHYPEKMPSKLFAREFNRKISLGTSFKGNIIEIEEKLYQKDTLLSRVAFHKIDSLIVPFIFFTRHFITHSFSLYERGLLEHFQRTASNTSLPHHVDNVSKLLRIADTGITSLEIKEFKEEEFNFPQDMDEKTRKRIIAKNRFKIYVNHNIFDEENKIVDTVKFDIDEESAGTIKLLSLASIMLDCLHDGDVLFVDELDKSLHPILTKSLIRIFNNPKTNPNNAQLIFATHDVSLLNSGMFRRDQILISEKNLSGCTNYYSVADFKGVRKNIPLEKYYMNGAFGGIPVINDYDFEFDFTKNGK